MLYEFNGVCHHCAEAITVIIHNGEIMADCPACNEAPFHIRPIAGIVYVVSNPNQTGVKVGRTTKTVEDRIKRLNSTGVPGSFVPIAIFPTDKPLADEKRVHKKMEAKRIAKEHFDFEPVEAALRAYRALNRRIKPIFFDQSVEDTFRLRLEEARIQMQLRLKGKVK
ncbi:MAG: GIY-YIG nuclease family protein [Candidatus Nealsonbacteria bacterium]|nr:GIY-YIG nuclease family protein [Candidatus Nealsonbacteria bacterium]